MISVSLGLLDDEELICWEHEASVRDIGEPILLVRRREGGRV